MDIRVLKYFIAVAREQNISRAAEQLHISQPPLSRTLKELERELGKTLFIRGTRKITLTDEGLILRKRAEEMLELMEKTKAEVMASNEDVSGDIYLGGGETEGMRFLIKVMKHLQQDCPKIRYHIFSGNAYDVKERLDNGLIDFGTFIEPVVLNKYDHLRLPGTDIWGVLMRKDASLSELSAVKPEQLKGVPLLCSRQMLSENGLSGWLGYDYEKLNIVATYNLINTPKLMVEEGIGSAICLDRLIYVSHDSNLCFRPLEPKLEAGLSLVWKKYQVFSKAAGLFLARVQAALSFDYS
jgi:DNA-binding transcriptional LysR family regulator